MKCVIEGAGWLFDVNRREQELERFERCLDLVDRAKENSTLFYSSELFYTALVGKLSFFELCAEDSPFPIPRLIQERVTAAFLRLRQWEDTDWPLDTNAAIDNGAELFLPSVAWMHRIKSTSPDEPAGVIVFAPVVEKGLRSVRVSTQPAAYLYFMREQDDWSHFHRYILTDLVKNSHGLNMYANQAFPNLEFVEGALFGIDRMSKPFVLTIKDVVRHLAAFSDYGAEIFSQSNEVVPNHFGKLGVDISDENGTTKSNKESRRQRTRMHKGRELVFWWHSKIQRDRDRIHIYIDRTERRPIIIVGVLCYHLV